MANNDFKNWKPFRKCQASLQQGKITLGTLQSPPGWLCPHKSGKDLGQCRDPCPWRHGSGRPQASRQDIRRGTHSGSRRRSVEVMALVPRYVMDGEFSQSRVMCPFSGTHQVPCHGILEMYQSGHHERPCSKRLLDRTADRDHSTPGPLLMSSWITMSSKRVTELS